MKRYIVVPAPGCRGKYIVFDTYTNLPQTRPTSYFSAVDQKAALERLNR